MDKESTKKMVEDIIDRKLNDFFIKNISFRAKKIGDTSTDLRQLATNAGVNQTIVQQLTNYFPLAGGDLNDGANIGTGSTTGTEIATAASQKLGFHGTAPTVQQPNTAGNVTAGATYTATEQAMLNDAYSVLRNKGFLS